MSEFTTHPHVETRVPRARAAERRPDSENTVLQLQRTAGNAVVTELLRRSTGNRETVQRKGSTPKKPKKTSSPVPKSCSDDAKACFSVSRHRAWLLKPGKVVVIEVSALGGRKGHPTPTGRTFTVINKDANHHSSKYKDSKTGKPAPMPHYVQFASEVGFHAGSLSTESHGCVHLSAADAKKFFDALEVGDRVDVVP